MESKEDALKRLKATRDELNALTKEDFHKIVVNKYGDGVANMVMGAGFDDYARNVLLSRLNAQISELENQS